MNIGERVGDYEIIQILGAGGMGQVYKVRNTLSERVEAMKVLLPNLESDPGLADRFLREIKTQATFDHPNIAKLHTAMRVGDQLLMFMEFVDGVSLAKELEKGPLAPGEAAAYTAQVLDALAYAHGRGVVHRDIKPANIMITDAGVAKLMDFGIARMEADSRLTKTGNAVGSLAYMSPEQINGGDPDPRSDIYSLGITLYEMVIGKSPFAGDSGFAIMSAHLMQTPVAPIELTPGLPPDLSDIILMAIAKDPARRFQSATAFRGALVNVFPGIAAPLRNPDSTETMPPPLGAKVAPAVPPPPPAPATAKIAQPLPIPVPVPAAAMPPAPVASSGVANSGVAGSSRRGIYMALGSVVTLAVLVAAVIEGPKLMHGGLSDAFGKGTGAPAASGPAPSAPLNDAVRTPVTTPDAAAPAAASDIGTPGSASSSASSSISGAAASGSPAPLAAPSVAPARPSSAPTAAASVQPTGQARGAQAADWHRLPGTPAAAPAPPEAAQNFAPAPSPAPAPQAAPAQPPPPAVNPELAELRQKFNETSIRASTARNGLNSFQQQQARQGLGLRADIREAQTRMDYQLQEATAYLQRGDIENARTSLRYAQNAVETIEKFLGR